MATKMFGPYCTLSIVLIGITFVHAYNYFRKESVSNNTMALRDKLKKLNKTALQKMCIHIGLDIERKRKEELNDFPFTSGVPTQHVTTVIDQDCHYTGMLPKLDDQVQVDKTIFPPFNKCNYATVRYTQLPIPSIVSIYNFIVTRACAGRGWGIQNF